MICQKCKNEGVRNSVLGKEFYYCRTCTDEIRLEEPPADKPAYYDTAVTITSDKLNPGWVYDGGVLRWRDKP